MKKAKNQATIATAWYTPLHPTRATTPRRVALALGVLGPAGEPGSGIWESVAGALKRCRHERVEVQDAPDLIIATWWKDTMVGDLNLPRDVPVVHLWVGSDTHHTRPHSRKRRHNWVVAPWLARLLKRRGGVTARVVPLAPVFGPHLLPQSPTPKVLVYCPERNRGAIKYCWAETVEVARACPDIEFTVLLKGGASPLPNITLVPRVAYEDMPALYADMRLLLRLTPSDGSSVSVMEALGFGRHVIWNWWAPGVTHVSNVEEAINAVHRLIDAPPYAGGVGGAMERRAQMDYAVCAGIDEAAHRGPTRKG